MKSYIFYVRCLKKRFRYDTGTIENVLESLNNV